jgi:Domain of Unknown Function (DUF1080)
MTRAPLFCGLTAAAFAAVVGAGIQDDGFVSPFNGQDLTGWVNVNCAPGTFFVKGGEVITTGHPTGYLRTERQYENFVADFEWMHVNKTEVGNSGFFVWADPLPAIGTPYTRAIEVQVLVNLERAGYYTSQGDLFSIWGAKCKPDRPHPQGWERCLPSERRCKGGGEWNHYKVIADNGVIKLHVNGKEVSGVSAVRPRKGYLALESEGAECHFRNFRIKELPSTNPKPEEVAAEAEGFVNLFTGQNLSGWKETAENKGHWQPRDWVLAYDSKGMAEGGRVWSEKSYRDFELIVDWKLPAVKDGDKPKASCGLKLRGEKGAAVEVLPDGGIEGSGPISTFKYPEQNGMKPAGQWNRFHVRMEGDRLTMNLNGTPLGGGFNKIEIAGMPVEGPIALFADGGPVEFGNIFIRELKK